MNEMNDLPTPPPSTPELTPAEEEAARLYVLSVNLRTAKDRENGMKARRIAIEEQIAALIPGPETGQKTVVVKDGSKLVITRGLSYKADLEKIESDLKDSDWPAPIATKTTRSLDVKGYEWYKKECQPVFQQIAQHVSVTPKKVSVALKLAEE